MRILESARSLLVMEKLVFVWERKKERCAFVDQDVFGYVDYFLYFIFSSKGRSLEFHVTPSGLSSNEGWPDHIEKQNET